MGFSGVEGFDEELPESESQKPRKNQSLLLLN